MPWTWRYEKTDGAVLSGAGLQDAIFASQGDAETIVGEFVANAVTHAGVVADPSRRASAENMGLRLLRRTGEVICAVLDPSDVAPVLKKPGSVEEAGRGLQMVDALSDVWGWSPLAGRGKAVWAILFCA